MSFSSGVFSINSSGQPVVTGTVISSTAFNALTADLATGLSTAILKDGTQTITANIPMSSYKFTGLAAGSAAGDSVRYEQSPASIMTTLGDVLYASAANTPARLGIGAAGASLETNAGATAPAWMPPTASVAAHATTMDPWNSRETVLTGGAVTFTDIADADYAGQVAWVYMNAAHIWTDGAVFDVQGGANYTAAIGDWVRINAITVSTFDVTVFSASGAPQRAGSVVQVVSVTKSDTFTMSSTTFADVTGLTASITPSSTSNKILVLAYVNGAQDVGAAQSGFKLLRDATEIANGDAASNRIRVIGGFSAIDANQLSGTVSINYLDSPASVSALTYKIQASIVAGTGTVFVNRTDTDTDTNAYVRAASTITLMEIKG